MNQLLIFFVRRAESLSDAGGVTLPCADIPLSEHGHFHARQLASRLPSKPLAILGSWMMRMHQRTAPLCERPGLTSTVDVDLDDFFLFDHGLIEGMDGPQPAVLAIW